MSEHRVKRAIIMAAGIGKRLRPLTLTTPKPLIEVNGIRMIDTIIDALLENSISDIVVVTGYLADKFETVRTKYPMIRFIYNPDYEKYNNISSLYYARKFLDTDVIIADADQIVNNKEVFSPMFMRSGYNAVRVFSHTDEWVMTVSAGIVTSCSRDGGDDGWQLFSVSRWSMEDAIKLRKFLEIEFEKNGKHDIYWDDIPMFIYFKEFKLGIRPMKKNDLIEIDSFDELRKLEQTRNNLEVGYGKRNA